MSQLGQDRPRWPFVFRCFAGRPVIAASGIPLPLVGEGNLNQVLMSSRPPCLDNRLFFLPSAEVLASFTFRKRSQPVAVPLWPAPRFLVPHLGGVRRNLQFLLFFAQALPGAEVWASFTFRKRSQPVAVPLWPAPCFLVPHLGGVRRGLQFLLSFAQALLPYGLHENGIWFKGPSNHTHCLPISSNDVEQFFSRGIKSCYLHHFQILISAGLVIFLMPS